MKLFYIIPNALTVCRLASGLAFLFWGALPARGLVLGGLILAAATDLVDGRIARALKVTSNLGGGLDTTADKVFALSLALKLTEGGILPLWAFTLVLAQYLALALIGTAYSLRFHHIPVPELWAHTAAATAVAVVIVGVTTLSRPWTMTLVILLAAANSMHIVIAWRRAIGIQE